MGTIDTHKNGDVTIACADDTDLDLTHTDCGDGRHARVAWGQWPPRSVPWTCSCACHDESGTTDEL